jgi:hypothetical protein
MELGSGHLSREADKAARDAVPHHVFGPCLHGGNLMISRRTPGELEHLYYIHNLYPLETGNLKSFLDKLMIEEGHHGRREGATC